MDKFITNFQTTAEVQAFSGTSDCLKPHVSLAKDDEQVFYFNAAGDKRIVCVISVSTTSYEIPIIYRYAPTSAKTNITKIEIDDVELPSIVESYQFSSTGLHTLKFELQDATTIGESLFRETKYSSIELPKTITTIEKFAFDNVDKLVSINMPKKLSSLGEGALRFTSLEDITLPKLITEINDRLFNYCTYLTSCTFSTSCTKIGDDAFQRCSRLKRINSDTDGVANLPNTITYIGESSFSACTSITNINVPEGVTQIPYSCFRNMTNLQTLTIPSGVISIDNYAFENCSSLTSITIEATTPPALSSNNAFNSTNKCPIYVPSQSLYTYQTTSIWSSLGSRLTAKT